MLNGWSALGCEPGRAPPGGSTNPVVLTDCIDDDRLELLELVGLDDPLLERRFDFVAAPPGRTAATKSAAS